MENNETFAFQDDKSGSNQDDEAMRLLSLKLRQRGFFDFQSSEIAEQTQENTDRIQDQQLQNEKGSDDKALENKIAELQNICQALTAANNNLLNRIDNLQNEREHQNRGSSEIEDKKSVNSNYTEIEFQLTELQKLVTEYRNNFCKQKQKTSQQIFKKGVENDRLRQQIEKLRAQNYKLLKKCDQNQRYLERQANYCQSLKMEIQSLKGISQPKTFSSQKLILNKTLSSEKLFDTFSSKYEDQSEDIDHNFSITIFNQMERMIKKLMDQLEHQRKMKNKMNAQINRLVEEIKNYEEQIKDRNNKIYYLQLDNIKKRSSTFSTVIKRDYSGVIDTTGNVTKEKQNSSASQSRNQSMRLKDKSSFSKTPDHINESSKNKLRQPEIKFMDLMGSQPLLSWNKKVWIGIKLLNIYDKKIKERKFKEIMLEDIVIKNLNSKNIGIMEIVDCSHKNFQGEGSSEENLISNMCMIMQNLLNEIPQNDESSVSYIYQKDEILRYLEEFSLDKKQGTNVNPIKSLKNYFQEIAMNYLY